MNSIIGFSNLLYETDLDLEQEKYSSLIRHSTKMLLNIVNDILDYSKIDNQKLILNPIPTNLYVELHSLYAQFKITTDEKDIDFYLEVDPRVGEIVEIDILRLIQILTNLLSNAIKFTPKFGKIKLTVGYIEGSRASQQLYFELVDSGIGISSEEIKNIFKVFEHANKSINTEFGGTGLGLSISNSLVKLTGS
jgi:signal transduction histidine kinase